MQLLAVIFSVCVSGCIVDIGKGVMTKPPGDGGHEDARPDPVEASDEGRDEDAPAEEEASPETPDCAQLHGGGCNVVDNCGCAGDMQCVIGMEGSPVCAVREACVAAGGLPVGADCQDDPGNCGVGTVCLSSGGDGRCYRWCKESADCPSGTSCSLGPFNVSLDPPCPESATIQYKACDLGCLPDKRCDPFSSTGCDPLTEACIFDPSCGTLLCTGAGPLTSGQECLEERCQAGLECFAIEEGGPFTCYRLCNDDHVCPSGDCGLFGYEQDQTLGACLSPPPP